MARLARTQSIASFTNVTAMSVVLMVLLTAASQFTVSPRMENLKKEMVSVQNTRENDPRRVEFNKLHQFSVFYEASVLLFGLAGMFLLVRETVNK